jgi:hypothetical protein
MTEPSGDRVTIWLSGSSTAWKSNLSPSTSPRVTDHFTRPYRILKPNSFPCHLCVQSFFVYCYFKFILWENLIISSWYCWNCKHSKIKCLTVSGSSQNSQFPELCRPIFCMCEFNIQCPVLSL